MSNEMGLKCDIREKIYSSGFLIDLEKNTVCLTETSKGPPVTHKIL